MFLRAVIAAVIPAAIIAPCLAQVVTDRFGRDVTRRGITLTDWEGHIANPAMRYAVRPTANARLPVTVQLRCNASRLYFDNPCEVGPDGTTKTFLIADGNSGTPFHIAIFPDRDSQNETHLLDVRMTDADGNIRTAIVPIHVIDQDRERPVAFHITLDYSHDRSLFFAHARHRRIFRQAADDWAYFFEDMRFDWVSPGSERAWVWDSGGFYLGRSVWNEREYAGMLLYLYGFHDPTSPRSGGDASWEGGWHTSEFGLIMHPLRRSGAVGIETDGNYNTLGWMASEADDDWWAARNLRRDQCDLYSIARHEIGHSLIFHSAHARVAAAHRRGCLDNEPLRAYLGANLALDDTEHIVGANDRQSLKGPFGRDYFGQVPARRWLTTKLDLLCAQAVGWRLRKTSAFEPLSVSAHARIIGRVGEPLAAGLTIAGGLSPYYCEVTSGTVPPGVRIDSFTGAIFGVPRAPGSHTAIVSFRDYDEWGPTVTRRVSFEVR